ncbi:MAG: FtsX-like permease family protein [Bacteroidota bacterium]
MAKTSFSWLSKMAWRDSRRNRGKLLLFISSIVVGIAALVAINSFGDNLQKDINQEAQGLLAADLLVEGAESPNDSLEQLLDTLGATDRAYSANFPSFIRFPKTDDSRLAQIKAIEGAYPFYGEFRTSPSTAVDDFRSGSRALIEDAIALQFGVVVGDSVRIGQVTFVVEGIIERVPGRSRVANAFAPLVYIPMEMLDSTELLQFGSLVEYQYYFKFEETEDVDFLAETILAPALEDRQLNYETVSSRKESYGQIFGVLTSFLNLVAFIALLLGCIGVASSVHIYIKDKLSSVAILRCLGASGQQAFLIFLIQISVIGLFGAIIGTTAGTLLQQVLPFVLGDFLPVERVSTDISWLSIGQGILTGVLVAVLFALLPLVRIRKVSPLRSLRASYEKDVSGKDPLRWLIYGLITAFVIGFTILQIGWRWEALFFTLAIAIGLLALFGMAKLLMWMVKEFFPTKWSYVWRQSIANLYRPNNQTIVLMIAIGLGTGLISTMYFTREMLLQQVQSSSSENQPNLILFNIQSDEKEAVADLVSENGLPVMTQLPIVTTRIVEIDSLSVSDILADSTSEIPFYLIDREIQISYRDEQAANETIADGVWHTESPEDGNTYISLEEDVADDLGVAVGSQLVFNVQGKDLTTTVGSLRSIKQEAMNPNFPIVFPEGVLESAPQINILTSRSDSVQQVVDFQRVLIEAFPSVTLFDIRQILQTLDEILGKIAFVIRFMALFSILTGIIVLISSVVLSKYQRIQESVLLRTLGANRKQILWINALEYLLLGSLAALTGMLLSIIGSFFLAEYAFQTPFQPNWWPPFLWFIGIALLTVFIGLVNSREVLSKPPLEILRREV